MPKRKHHKPLKTKRFAQADPKEIEQAILVDRPGAGPISLIEDGDTGDRFLVYMGKDGVRVDLRVQGDTFFATQAQMADMFGIDRTVVGRHIRNVFSEGELPEERNVHSMHLSPTKPTKLYSLNVMISVGYRVESKLGTMFRIWATDTLFQYLTKGFVLDDRRLKNPDGQPDFFDELLARIADIRSSEKRMWTRVLELASFCNDYNKDDTKQHVEFFAEIQNTMHWAASQRTAPEIVRQEVNADKDYAGVLHFDGRQPTVDEARTAKNLLGEDHISALNHITGLTLQFFESQAEQRRPTTLEQFLGRVRELVKLDGRPLKRPGYAGEVSRPQADKWAAEQVRIWKAKQKALKEESGERALANLAARASNRKKPEKKG
jgi:hypothetical protein